MLPAIVFTKTSKLADDLAKSVITVLRDKQSLAERSLVGDKSDDKILKNLNRQLKKMEREPTQYEMEIFEIKEKIYDLENFIP